MKLTEQRIAKLTVEQGRKDRLIFDDMQRGLAVRVTATGGRSYLAQYTLHGRKHRVALGACSALSLAKAREAASAVMGDVAKGKNPAVDRREATAQAKRARDRLTLDALIDRWSDLHLSQKRPRYASEATRALRYAFQRHLERPAEELDRAAVVRALDGLTRKEPKAKGGETSPAKLKGTAIAGRTGAYGRAVYAWAVKRGVVQSNPFASLPAMASTAKRERVLSDAELIKLWEAAGKSIEPYSSIVRLLLLTGQRREEVAGMAWSELTDDLATWTIPASRTKNGTPHIVPLSEPAQDLIRKLLPDDREDMARELEARRETNALVFPGEKGVFGGWSKAKARLDTSSGVTEWRLHDLRRTLATGFQRQGVRLEVTEAVLNHVSGSRAGIVGVYQRHDWAAEKRAALNNWGGHVERIVSSKGSASNVVTLKAG